MELLERAGELDAIDGAVRGVRAGRGGALLVEGPAGIGKTGLLRAAIARARAAGVRVLGARAGELEQGFAWSLVRQLFEALVTRAPAAERTALLAGAAALAAPALGLDAGGDETTFATLHGLFWLTVNLTRAGPALLAVDDLQWADPPSLRFLSYLAPRLEDLPVLLVATARDDGAPIGLVERPLRPAALSPAASAVVVRGEIGDAGDELCRACHEMTGGNPFLLHELVRSIREAGLGAAPDAAARVRSMTPQVVSRSVLLRLGRLPPSAAELARAVAVLGQGAGVRRAGALAGLDPDAAAAAADDLIGAGIVHGDEQRLEFSHPIVRASVYGDLSGPRRGRWHARAAELLAGEAARPAEIGTHLLAATAAASPSAVETLRAAAAEARDEGAPELAAAFLRRALAEPPAPEARADVLAELGRVLAGSGDPVAGAEHLEAALALVDDQPRRVAFALALGSAWALAGRFVDAARLLDGVLRALGDGEPALEGELEATLLAVARYDLRTSDVRHAVLERVRARAAGGRRLDPRLHAHLSVEIGAAGEDLAGAVRHARRALEGIDQLAETAVQHVPETISVLVFADLADEARDAVAAATEIARRRGSPLGMALATSGAAFVALWGGAVDEAVAYARESLRHVDAGWVPVITTPFLAAALAERDEIPAARAELAARGLDGELRPGWPTTVVRFIRGWVEAAAGDHRAAVALLTAAGEDAEAFGVRNPATMPWRSWAAVSLAALGEHAEARRLAAEELARARRWGAARAVGVALRAVGSAQPGPDGLARLEEAVRTLEPAPAPLELARALTDLGARQRRGGRRAEARATLARALDVAHHCGGIALARRAREELVLAGAKPRRAALRGRDALTPGELRVAQMAAAGATNRAIAEALFVTPRTVEHHLTSAYAKLSISSREQLAAALSGSASPA